MKEIELGQYRPLPDAGISAKARIEIERNMTAIEIDDQRRGGGGIIIFVIILTHSLQQSRNVGLVNLLCRGRLNTDIKGCGNHAGITGGRPVIQYDTRYRIDDGHAKKNIAEVAV